MWTVPAIVAVIGGIALLAGLFGGLEADQFKVAPLPRELRILSGIIGLIFLGIAIRLSPSDQPAGVAVRPTAVPTSSPPALLQLSPTTLPTLTARPIPTVRPPALPISNTPQVPTPTVPQIATSAGTTLLYSSLDSVDAITSPVVGLGGRTTLAATDFAPGQAGSGAHFMREGENCGSPAYQAITFPVSRGDARNIMFDRGELEFWYKPDYDASDFN